MDKRDQSTGPIGQHLRPDAPASGRSSATDAEVGLRSEDDPHPKYGPCDGFGPDGQCSECMGPEWDKYLAARDAAGCGCKVVTPYKGGSYAVMGAHVEHDPPDLHARLAAAELALQSLTPGGSEFVGDVAACVEYVRRYRDEQHDLIKRFKQRADTAERDLAAARERAEKLESRSILHNAGDAMLVDHHSKLQARLAEIEKAAAKARELIWNAYATVSHGGPTRAEAAAMAEELDAALARDGAQKGGREG